MEAYNELLKQVKKPTPPKYGTPWNPSYISIISLFLPFLATSIGLALNWRRLGKPQWSLPTLLVGIIGTIVLVVAFVFGIPYFDLSSHLGASVFAIIFTMPVSFFIAMIYMQSSAYKVWQQSHDAEEVYTYPYQWYKAALITILLVLVMVGVINWQVIQSAPKEFKNSQFSVTVNHTWEIMDKEQYCTYGCELLLADARFHYTTILFEQFPVEANMSSEELYDAVWPELLEQTPNFEVVEYTEDTTIDGHKAIYLEYYEAHDDGTNQAYYGQYYVTTGDMGFVITARSENPGIFREKLKHIQEVINSVQFNVGTVAA